MEKRLFFLNQEGWFEVEVTENLKNASPDELAKWVYAMVDRHKYRNYLITENPEMSNISGSPLAFPCTLPIPQTHSSNIRHPASNI